MKLNEIITALKRSKFECVAGSLENHVAFRALETITDDEYNMCCLGPAHPCNLNVNDGFCCAIECMFKVHENNKKLKMDAQGAGCPHCGHYCTGKTAFCNPPIKSTTQL